MGARHQGQPIGVCDLRIPVVGQRDATGELYRTAQMAARGLATDRRPHQGEQRQDRLRDNASGSLIRSGYRQVGFGELANTVDAGNAHRLDDHHLGQLREPAQVGYLGGDHQVVGNEYQQPLVRGLGYPADASQVADGASRARLEERHALLVGRGSAVVRGEPGRIRWRTQLRRGVRHLRRGQWYCGRYLVGDGRFFY